VKTTIELPDALFRSAKSHAAQEGLSLRIFFERAVTSQLRRTSETEAAPRWRRSFGKLKDIKATTRKVQKVVDREFSHIEAETWK
jgi:hypothetical protein